MKVKIIVEKGYSNPNSIMPTSIVLNGLDVPKKVPIIIEGKNTELVAECFLENGDLVAVVDLPKSVLEKNNMFASIMFEAEEADINTKSIERVVTKGKLRHVSFGLNPNQDPSIKTVQEQIEASIWNNQK